MMDLGKVKDIVDCSNGRGCWQCKDRMVRYGDGSCPADKLDKGLICSELIKAIAELEKPADDISDIYEDLGEIAGLSVANRMAQRIQQYAESYHAKKYAECNKGGGWISVENRLPECNNAGESDFVLIFDEYDDEVKVGFYWLKGNVFCSQNGDEDLEGVTHWQPLPEAPRA